MIEFSPKQDEAMNAIASEKYSFILFGGAMGGGKTFLGLSALLIMCEIFPKSRWCVIRENTEKLRTTTIPSLKKLNPSGKIRESPYEYTHPNGSVIMFKGENYDNDKELMWLRGLEVSGFLFEEINECQELTLSIAFGRAGRWESTPRPKPIIIATCNPSKNWVKQQVYDKYINGTLSPKWLYITSKITDNPFLTEDYVENLKNMPKFQYKVLVEGDWDITLKTGGEFYKGFDIEKHIQDFEYNPDIPLHISWDDNVNPYLPLGIFQVVGSRLVCIDEIAGIEPLNTVKSVCNEFIKRYQGHKSGLFIYGDATASKQDTKLEKGYNFYRLIQDHLKQFKPTLRLQPSNPSVTMRGNFINTVFESNYEGIEVYFNSACKLTINDLASTKEDKDGGKFKEMETNPITKVRYQKVGHFSDLFDYIFCTLFAKEFDKYQRGGRKTEIKTVTFTRKHQY